MKILKLLVAGALMSLSVLASAESAGVDVKQGAAMQSQGALLIDVREPDEYVQGLSLIHI